MEVTQNGDLDAFLDTLDALPASIQQSLSGAAQTLSQSLKQEIESNLSGQILQSKTGRLLNSIHDEQVDGDSHTHVEIAVDDSVPYAAILEYGGETKAHIIQALQGKPLAFIDYGKQMFLHSVMHPGSNIPAFGYMSNALDALQEDITDGLTEAVTEPMESLT